MPISEDVIKKAAEKSGLNEEIVSSVAPLAERIIDVIIKYPQPKGIIRRIVGTIACRRAGGIGSGLYRRALWSIICVAVGGG